MLMMLVTYCEQVNINKFDVLDDGDDCLLIVEHENFEHVQQTVFDQFLQFGMEMRVDGVARQVNEVVFCRSKPVEISPGRWTFVRDFRDVVSKSLTGIRHWGDPKYRLRVIKAIGMCELSLNYSVPVLQAFAVCLLQNTQDVSFDEKYLSDGLRARWRRETQRSSPGPITRECREQFAVAFDCSYPRQLQLEEFFLHWKFNNNQPLLWGVEWGADWIPVQSFIERYWQNAE
jgi:hypothetical protein